MLQKEIFQDILHKTLLYMNSFEKLILESYEEAKYLDTFDQLIEFVSESHDIYMDEDCTIEELLEALNEMFYLDPVTHKMQGMTDLIHPRYGHCIIYIAFKAYF